jgi:hypothetical protein
LLKRKVIEISVSSFHFLEKWSKSVNKDKLLCLYSFETKGDVHILHRRRKGISMLYKDARMTVI